MSAWLRQMGWTPLHVAAGSGEAKAAELLIGEGAAVDAQSIVSRLFLHAQKRD